LGGRTNPVELEQMNQLAQPFFVTAVSDRSRKGSINAPARRTTPQAIVIASSE
jgi:hypothetical protein